MDYVLKTGKGVRAFLNEVGEPDTGHVQGLIAEPSYPGGPIEAELTVGDCTRTVTLHFDFSDEKERQAALRKLDRLIEAAQHMRTLVDDAPLGD